MGIQIHRFAVLEFQGLGVVGFRGQGLGFGGLEFRVSGLRWLEIFRRLFGPTWVRHQDFGSLL